MSPKQLLSAITDVSPASSTTTGHRHDTWAGEWAASLQWEDLTPKLLQRCTHSMIDTLGVGLAGTTHENFLRSMAMATSLYEKAESASTVLNQPGSYAAPVAAWLNGTAMHALDYDDTSFVGILHPSTVVLPAILALGETHNASYQDILLSYIAGVETQLYVGDILGHAAYEAGHWTTGSLGVIGAAVASGKLLGMSSVDLIETLRLSLHLSAGMRSVHGSLAKAHLAGMAARTGLECALAVKHGMNGGTEAYSGRYGFYNVLGLGPCLQDAALPGERFRLLDPGISFKQYPLCSATQAAIDAVRILKARHHFHSQAVKRIDCHATALVVQCLRHGVPRDASQAQFSMPFALATAALCETVAPEHLSDDWLKNPDMQALALRVHLHQDDSLINEDQLIDYPEAARVTIELDDGRRLTETVKAAKGMPNNPFDEGMLKQKFLQCAHAVIGDNAHILYEKLSQVCEHTTVQTLLQLCRNNAANAAVRNPGP